MIKIGGFGGGLWFFVVGAMGVYAGIAGQVFAVAVVPGLYLVRVGFFAACGADFSFFF